MIQVSTWLLTCPNSINNGILLQVVALTHRDAGSQRRVYDTPQLKGMHAVTHYIETT